LEPPFVSTATMNVSHTASTKPLSVIVLGGGPDAEREVSLWSSEAIVKNLGTVPGYQPARFVIDTLTQAELRAIPGDVIFPALHGGWGEGGPLQDLLEADGRPFVGSMAGAARTAMDKIATKMIAATLGIPTKPAGILNTIDAHCPFPLPVVIKPTHDGSSVGLHICRTRERFEQARQTIMAERSKHPARVYMVEDAVPQPRELTVGVLDGTAMAPIEIIVKPKVGGGEYAYEDKYLSDDTKYVVDPQLPAGVTKTIQRHAETIVKAVGARHLARVDFLLDPSGAAWMLEVNTLPGFTSHSLFPMAAQHAGFSFAALTARLVDMAIRDHSTR